MQVSEFADSFNLRNFCGARNDGTIESLMLSIMPFVDSFPSKQGPQVMHTAQEGRVDAPTLLSMLSYQLQEKGGMHLDKVWHGICT